MENIKLIAGPMATLSHQAFRNAVEKFGGADEYFTEMINAASLVNMGPFEKYYLMNDVASDKIVWQLTGKDSHNFDKAAEIVLAKNGIGVDINMGCSAPQIYKTGAGISWMLKDPKETEELVKLVKSVMPQDKRLSVKMRLGKDDFTEQEFFDFVEMLVKNGVQTVTLHPRTIKEKLRGFPRYSYAEKIKQIYKDELEVFVNGEVKDKESFEYCLSHCPSINGVMISRESAVKPWIFSQLKGGHDTVDRKQLALDFVDDIVKYQPKEFYPTRIQRFFSYYCQQFKFGHYFATQILNYHSVEETKEKINDYFVKQSEEQYITY